jgi:hypothetical protein
VSVGDSPEVVVVAEDVRVWVEPETGVFIRAVTSHGDPVELSAAEARHLAQVLSELADRAE